MKRQLFSFLSLAILICCLACGGDSGPGFPVGTWQLTEITFESGNSSMSIDVDNRLPSFKLTFSGDNSLNAEGTGTSKVYTWSYDESTGIVSIGGDANLNIEATIIEDSFSYQAYAVSNMSATTGDERQIAELAANSFIQSLTDYDPQGVLSVYFKFEKI